MKDAGGAALAWTKFGRRKKRDSAIRDTDRLDDAAGGRDDLLACRR